MFGSESSRLLPSFQKSPKFVPPIPPFKSSLNRNPSYFSIVRSPDIVQEKKSLKEENWKLKQLLHSLNEEMLRLKQKLSQKTETRANLSEIGTIVSQNQYMDVLQDSLKSLRFDLNKKKQENAELKKKIYKAAPENPRLKSSRGSFNSAESMQWLDKEAQEKKINELIRTVTYLKSELKIIQDEKIDLELTMLNQQELIEELKMQIEKKIDLKIVKLESVVVQGQKPAPMQHFDTEEKENLKNGKIFMSFLHELDCLDLKVDDVVRYIEKSSQQMSAGLFVETLEYFKIRLSPEETEESLEFIKSHKNIDKNEFFTVLRQLQKEFESISAAAVSNSAAAPMIKITKPVESGVSTIFDNISLCVRELKIDSYSIIKSCQEHLPDAVNLTSILKFFNEFANYIKDPSDKTFVAVDFMEGFELKSRNEIIEKCLNGFFRIPEGLEVDKGRIAQVMQKVLVKEEEVLIKCKEFDTLHRSVLSWEVLFEILKEKVEIDGSEALDLKLYCYSIGKNLKKIPYLAFLDQASSHSN